MGALSERIDFISVCQRCGEAVEHITAIPDPYWRHLTAQPHPAKPDPRYTQEVPR